MTVNDLVGLVLVAALALCFAWAALTDWWGR